MIANVEEMQNIFLPLPLAADERESDSETR